MTHAQLIPFLLVLGLISVGIIIAVTRSILRELKDGGLADDECQARRTEERKNERIRKELARMSDEEMLDAKRKHTAEHWDGKGDA
jgi:hypothetical protein